MHKIELEFGIYPPRGATVAWGARAYYTFKKEPKIDLLWDRQSVAGPEEARRALCAWVNATGLPLLEKELNERFVRTCDDVTVTVTEGGYTLTASPRRSYGYLYLGAWQGAPKEHGTTKKMKKERRSK